MLSLALVVAETEEVSTRRRLFPPRLEYILAVFLLDRLALLGIESQSAWTGLKCTLTQAYVSESVFLLRRLESAGA